MSDMDKLVEDVAQAIRNAPSVNSSVQARAAILATLRSVLTLQDEGRKAAEIIDTLIAEMADD